MRSFVEVERSLGSVPGAVVKRLSALDVGRGREGLYRNQLPVLLTELALRARTESITASSALEGVIVADPQVAARIIDNKAPTLRTRGEQELAGYRSALDYVLRKDWQPLNVGLLLHLHRELFAYTDLVGGMFKTEDNVVVDRTPDGSTTVRFTPVAAAETEFYTAELVNRYETAVAQERHHPVLLIGLFVLDLLTIHPFADGNGRVARIATNALLDASGYQVCRFISLEQLIAESADSYYSSLLASTRGWHQEANDPWPWLRYFVDQLALAYETFERRLAAARSGGTKQQRVMKYVLASPAAFIRIHDIRVALPGVSDQTIRLALATLKRNGLIVVDQAGRNAAWRRTSPSPD